LFLALAASAALTPAALAQEAPPPAAPTAASDELTLGDPLLDFLLLSPTGWILDAIYLVFVAMLIWLLLDIRGGVMMPIDFIETMEDAIQKRRFKEAFEIARSDGSMLARVMTAGMTRLQHGLQEAREAAGAMVDSLRARKDHVVAYIAIIGTLGPLIGLVGTVSGMISSFGVLGRGGTPNPAQLAEGISHALNATLVGIFLACLAIPAYSFFRNRLARIANDVSLMTDDLLTQMYYSSRRPADTAATKTAAPVPGQPG
jgi:biopolymer transport protein ExbB